MSDSKKRIRTKINEIHSQELPSWVEDFPEVKHLADRDAIYRYSILEAGTNPLLREMAISDARRRVGEVV